MKLDYRILWLDDNIDAFIQDRHLLKVEKFIDGEGFTPQIDPVKSYDDFFKKLNGNNYDLILTDYHMRGKNGDKVIEEVRKSNVFTEILFYTAQKDLKNINKLDRISFLQTNRNHHQQVVKKIISLIGLTIDKFHDIVVMRGMIMNETSDLDNQKIKLIHKFIDKNEPKTIIDLKLTILEEVNQSFSSKLKKINEDWKIKDSGFKNLIKDNFVFSSSYKIKTLGWILKHISEDDFSNEYEEEIIKIRNLFAHVTLQEDKDEDGNLIKKYFKKDGEPYDAEYCKNIRKNINKHKENLKKLEEKLNE